MIIWRPPPSAFRAFALLAPLSAAGVAPAARAAVVLNVRAHSPAAFMVVVHESNATATLPREQIARLFLRKVTRWPDGEAAEPVDLAPTAPARVAFTQQVLGKSVSTVRAYWQQRIFSGVDVPPPEKAGEAEALEFVRTHPAAVAYVSTTEALPAGVRALRVAE